MRKKALFMLSKEELKHYFQLRALCRQLPDEFDITKHNARIDVEYYESIADWRCKNIVDLCLTGTNSEIEDEKSYGIHI